MKARALLLLLIAAVLVFLAVRLIRPTPPTSPNNPPAGEVTEAPNPTSRGQAGSESTKDDPTATPRPAQRESTPDAQANWTSEPLPSSSNLQEQLEELARREGVPLNLLTQQLAAQLSNAFSQEMNRPWSSTERPRTKTGYR